MARPRGMLLASANGFRLLWEAAGEVCAETISPTESEPVEAALLTKLAEILPRSDLLVGCSAGQCVPVRLASAPASSSHTALTYALEEHLPWSAEELTGQLLKTGTPSFALAVRTDEWRTLFGELRSAGHTVEHLAPAAVLRLGVLRQGQRSGPSELWLFTDDEGTQFFGLQNGSITEWRFWPTQGEAQDDSQLASLIAAELQVAGFTGTLQTAGVASPLLDGLRAAGFDVEEVEADPTSDEWLWRGTLGTGRQRNPRVNLAVADLASASPVDSLRRSARWLAVCLMLVCAVSAGGLWWRSTQWEEVAAATHAEQVELFRATFPDTPVPQAIAARFRSDHRRLVGERGGEAIPELPQSVIPALAASLTAHAAPFRSRFEEISIDGATLELECEFRSHDEAVQMSERLRQRGVLVDSPQLQKLDDKRVGARLRGSVQRIAPDGKANDP